MFQHFLVLGLRLGMFLLLPHIDIGAKIHVRLVKVCVGGVYCHLSYWSLVMNCSRLHCMMQDTQLASHMSHMNLTGLGLTMGRQARQTTTNRTATFMSFLSLCQPTTDIKIIKRPV